MEAYKAQLRSRRDPIAGVLQQVFERLRRQPRRVVFAEGEEEQVIRAAASFVHQGLGSAFLVGRERAVRETAQSLGVELGGGIEIINAALSKRCLLYTSCRSCASRSSSPPRKPTRSWKRSATRQRPDRSVMARSLSRRSNTPCASAPGKRTRTLCKSSSPSSSNF